MISVANGFKSINLNSKFKDPKYKLSEKDTTRYCAIPYTGKNVQWDLNHLILQCKQMLYLIDTETRNDEV